MPPGSRTDTTLAVLLYQAIKGVSDVEGREDVACGVERPHCECMVAARCMMEAIWSELHLRLTPVLQIRSTTVESSVAASALEQS